MIRRYRAVITEPISEDKWPGFGRGYYWEWQIEVESSRFYHRNNIYRSRHWAKYYHDGDNRESQFNGKIATSGSCRSEAKARKEANQSLMKIRHLEKSEDRYYEMLNNRKKEIIQ